MSRALCLVDETRFHADIVIVIRFCPLAPCFARFIKQELRVEFVFDTVQALNELNTELMNLIDEIN